jgi:hypothetical protein
MAIDIMSPAVASSEKLGGCAMANVHGKYAVQAGAGGGQITLSPYRCDDPTAPYVCNPAPNASPPRTPSGRHGTVRIDRNKP